MADSKVRSNRWPRELYEEIKRMAEERNQSFNSFVVYLTKKAIREMQGAGK